MSTSTSVVPLETAVLIGVVALVTLILAEGLLHAIGLHQPKSFQRERLSFYLVTLSWRLTVVFSLLDAIALHWTIVRPGLSSVRYVGIPFLVAGIVVRIAARLTLGKHFSGLVQTTERHRLVTSGIYSCIQHPAYLGYLCLLFGFPVCFGSIGGFACAVVTGIPALSYRIRIEEKALLEWFGDEYEQYRRRTRRLVPFVW
jgi:protein-S-isoprenylcysteine O-methyltransferase Ste14